MELVVLCGGQGTRLRSVISDVPKPLAPVGDGVFLDHLLAQYFEIGFKTATLLACYMGEKIEAYAKNSIYRDRLRVIVEPEQLGTGGAIAHCLNKLPSSRYLCVNGDTYFDQLTTEDFKLFCNSSKMLCVVGKNIGRSGQKRFGGYKIDNKNSVLLRRSKDGDDVNFLSLGLYIIDSNALPLLKIPKVPFSIDDFLQDVCEGGNEVSAIRLDCQFIDIGVPEDYHKFLCRNEPR